MGLLKTGLAVIWAFLSNLLPFGNKDNPQLASASGKGSEKPQSNQQIMGLAKTCNASSKRQPKQASTQVKDNGRTTLFPFFS
jgi:hypothetical protein